jgi:hypothetical protein
MEAITNAGQKVRVRPASPVARGWKIPNEAEGTVLCRYRLLNSRTGAAERLDVRFSPRLVIWGAPAVEFEAIGEIAPQSPHHRTR